MDSCRARKSEEKYASGATSLGTGMTRGSEAMTWRDDVDRKKGNSESGAEEGIRNRSARESGIEVRLGWRFGTGRRPPSGTRIGPGHELVFYVLPLVQTSISEFN